MYRNEQQKDFARKLRREMTPQERLLWSRLRSEQLLGAKFRRQAAIGKYIVDFVCFDAKVIVELDGGQHNTELGRVNDERRSQWLESQGFVVLRFWNFDVDGDLDAVLEKIFSAVSLFSAPTPSPTPPHKGEGLRNACP